MPYGELTPAMEQALVPHIAGREVWDLGAGDFTYSLRLLELGAGKVVAVEKERSPRHRPPPSITAILAYFKDVEMPESIDVAFVSWPQNTHLPGLVQLLERAKVAVYLGSNVDNSACGSGAMFTHFRDREVLASIPHRRNSFAIYGSACSPRPPLPDEWAFGVSNIMGGTTDCPTFDEALAGAAFLAKAML